MLVSCPVIWPDAGSVTTTLRKTDSQSLDATQDEAPAIIDFGEMEYLRSRSDADINSHNVTDEPSPACCRVDGVEDEVYLGGVVFSLRFVTATDTVRLSAARMRKPDIRKWLSGFSLRVEPAGIEPATSGLQSLAQGGLFTEKVRIYAGFVQITEARDSADTDPIRTSTYTVAYTGADLSHYRPRGEVVEYRI